MLQYQKTASKNTEDKIVNYQLLSGFLVCTFSHIWFHGAPNCAKISPKVYLSLTRSGGVYSDLLANVDIKLWLTVG